MINVSGEAINYTPVSEDEIYERIKDIREKESDIEYLRKDENLRKYYSNVYTYNKDIERYLNANSLNGLLISSRSLNSPFSGEVIKYAVANGFFLGKKDLKDGSVYKGNCRNASYALWHNGKFHYIREKFGHSFIEDINHPEEDDGFDLFIPEEECFDEEIIKKIKEYLYD